MNKIMKQATVLIGSTCFCASLAYATGGGMQWGYSGDTGPENWGKLSSEYEMCGKGKNQSPVNITGMVESALKPISFSYNASPLIVTNNGHTIKISYAPGSSMTVDGHTYQLIQTHWHTPSENNVEGQSFPMEAHFVHADSDGKLAVLGLLYSQGTENKSIGNVWNKMPVEVGGAVKDDNIKVNPMDMLPANKDYYRFDGSLTTPPCSEGVLWMVFKEAALASEAQINKFHSTFHGDTNRPVQALNDRKILK